jgi:hypothetical protein
MQGATIEWTGVIGQPRDFSRNWSYTALSRAREPVEILLVDERAHLAGEREEIAPNEPVELNQHHPFARLRERMRERDDEDLALEQMESSEQKPDQMIDRHDPIRASADRSAALPAGDAPASEGQISPTRARIYSLEEQLQAIHERLGARRSCSSSAGP